MMQKSKQAHHKKKVMYHLPVLEEMQDFALDTVSDGEEVTLGSEVPDSEPPSLIMHEEQMAAISKTDMPGRMSKRRAKSVDESSLERAERMKAAWNLDFKGNTDQTQPSLLVFSNDEVLNNLGAVGISLGHDEASIDPSSSFFRQVKLDSAICKLKIDIVDDIFEVEEKEKFKNEEVDKLILNSLCSEIMDEVMDLGSAYPKDCNTTPMFNASSTTTKRVNKKKQGKGKNSV
jgi:hypothetical protein